MCCAVREGRAHDKGLPCALHQLQREYERNARFNRGRFHFILGARIRMKEGINKDGQDEQDKSKAEKANLRFLIQNLKSQISNLFILSILSIPANSFILHPFI
jgi:hypothetical protein